MKNFKTYSLALNFASKALKLSPPSVLKNQLHRAIISIPANLAEGSAKRYKKDRLKYFNIAYASAKETKTHLFLSPFDTKKLEEELDIICASIYKLMQNCRGEE